ncbi:MAG: hypothetical protein C4K58_04940 [Flavobacteriaceae bacterium]|nr:MAG: hypothetical protein C4K58_04940 [Flavobacteriaceae bacterium]
MKKLFLSLSVLSLMLVSCKSEPKEKTEESVEILFQQEGTLQVYNDTNKVAQFSIEVADDEFQRENGLMNRDKLGKDQGMLFIFQDSAPRRFWMHNTRIPLDIIYLDKDKKIVNIAKNAQPFDETGVEPSASDAMYVLEINAGLSDSLQLEPGKTRIEFQLTQ